MRSIRRVSLIVIAALSGTPLWGAGVTESSDRRAGEPEVTGGIASRYLQVLPQLGGPHLAETTFHPIAIRVECGDVVGWMELLEHDYDDNTLGNQKVNIAVGRADCDDDYFITADDWTDKGNNQLYVTGLSVPPGSSPTVYVVQGTCGDPIDSTGIEPDDPTWVFCDSDGDGQVTFFNDLNKQFLNSTSYGFSGFTGPDPGIEVDTQGNSPTVPDGQVTSFADINQCFRATVAGGGDTWTGDTCP